MARAGAVRYRIFLDSKQAEGALSSFQRKALDVSRRFAGLTVALGGTGVALERMISAAQDNARATAKLDAAISATGQSATLSSSQFDQYNAQLQRMTGFAGASLVEAEAMLVTFGATGDQVKQLLPLVADMAAFLDRDLKSTAEGVGKAFTRSASALQEFGVTVSDAQKKAYDLAGPTERAALLAEILGQNYGGAAEKINKTTGGFKSLQNSVDDAAAAAGELLALGLNDFLLDMSDALQTAVKYWSSLNDEVTGFNEEISSSKNRRLESLTKLMQSSGKGMLDGIRLLKEEFPEVVSLAENSGITYLEAAKKSISATDSLISRMRNLAKEEKSRADAKAKQERKAAARRASRSTASTGLSAAQIEQQRVAALDAEAASLDKLHAQLKSRLAIESQLADGKKEAAETTAELQRIEERLWEIVFEGSERAKDSLSNYNEAKTISALQSRLDAQKLAAEQAENIAAEQAAKEVRIAEAAERAKIDAVKAAESERMQISQMSTSQIMNSYGVLTGAVRQFAMDSAAGQENAAGRAAVAVLAGIGNQMVGLGAMAAGEGTLRLLQSYGADPTGYGLVALGGGLTAAGIGMGGAASFANASFGGGSISAQPQQNQQLNTSSTPSGQGNVGGTGENITIINNAPSFSGMRDTVDALNNAENRVSRYRLGDK